MKRQYVIDNARELERMRAMVQGMNDEDLNLMLYKEGWTVAVALAHLAFWDQRRLILVRKWKQNGVTPSPMDENTVNDTLLPFLLEISPRCAADLAISIAGELDRELGSASPEFVNLMEQTGDRHALNRAIHRKMHLDDIETLLLKK
jgi:hypothetical protein